MTRTICLIAALFASASTAMAQGAPEGWQLGAVGVVEASPLIGDDRSLALPFVAYRSDAFSVGLDGARYTVFDRDGQQFQVIAQPRFPLIDEDEPEFSGMSRDLGLDFGGSFSTSAGRALDISVTALAGVTSAQTGQEVDLRFSHRISDAPVSVYAGAQWQSEALTEYLYGVGADETAAGRPAYAPGAAVTPYIGVNAALPVGENAAVIGRLEAQQLPDTITDSPIVDRSVNTRATIGIVFNF
ncbi:MAG: MipA/OmpV family protein [Pseudomonadota bacterium]